MSRTISDCYTLFIYAFVLTENKWYYKKPVSNDIIIKSNSNLCAYELKIVNISSVAFNVIDESLKKKKRKKIWRGNRDN